MDVAEPTMMYSDKNVKKCNTCDLFGLAVTCLLHKKKRKKEEKKQKEWF